MMPILTLRYFRHAACLLMLAACPVEAAPKPRPATPAAAVEPACVSRVIPASASGGAVRFQDCAEAPEMISLRGGVLRMGDPLANGLTYDQPAHTVRVAAFALSRTEVSVAQWQSCVRAGACAAVGAEPAFSGPAQPVVNVSWSDAQSYLTWLSRRSGKHYRLPTEAEWEYAARAGQEDRYTWGNRTDDACRFANAFDLAGHGAQPLWTWQIECDDGYAATAPVGSFAPNRWGFHDMLGNVWEWVQDCWHSDYSGAPTDGSAWVAGGECEKRVNRGGGWGNHPRTLTVSNRDGDPMDSRSDGLGFRVARDVAAAAGAGPENR